VFHGAMAATTRLRPPDYLIRPVLIETQWDEIPRFIATPRLKVATASQLFRRLNSYSRRHPLYRALSGLVQRGPPKAITHRQFFAPLDDWESQKVLQKMATPSKELKLLPVLA
jgi:hypothetical protein